MKKIMTGWWGVVALAAGFTIAGAVLAGVPNWLQAFAIGGGVVWVIMMMIR